MREPRAEVNILVPETGSSYGRYGVRATLQLACHGQGSSTVSLGVQETGRLSEMQFLSWESTLSTPTEANAGHEPDG